MNYELFLEEFSGLSAKVKEKIAAQKRLSARVEKAMDAGDLRSAAKDMTALEEAAKELHAALEAARACFDAFDGEAYLSSGDFTAQFVALCEENAVDIRESETEGIFEVFPYRVKIDPADVWIDRKKASTFRPKTLAGTLAQGRAKLLSASFNPVQFLAELSSAYDLCALASAKGKELRLDADLYLQSIYKYLTPMRRFRRDYDMQAFAFDLARLYSSEPMTTADGRAYQFGPSRNNNRAIRILDGAGREQFLATVRFYSAEG